jgi:N utilization substance protein A
MIFELSQIINQLGKEKGIKKDIIVSAIKEALEYAARKKFGQEKEIEAYFDDDTGEFEILEYKEVVEDVSDPELEISLEEAQEYDPDAQVNDSIGFRITTKELGRIAAQTAKQIILQKVKEAEREVIFDEYIDKKGEIVNGIIHRFEKDLMIVDLGKTEAIMPPREQVKRERYRQGDRIRAYIKDVVMSQRGPEIILSRTDPRIVLKIFELEVPEIYEGIVSVVSIAREPGSRTKLAVKSRDKDIDPVGACVGLRGTRVQKVVEELKGEKIDIVQWEEDPARFACNALSPAEIIRVLVNETEQSMEVIVPEDQLMVAIGRKGQNVKLASKLISWNIEVRQEGKAEEALAQAEALFENKEAGAEVETTEEAVSGEEAESVEEEAGAEAEVETTEEETVSGAEAESVEEEAASGSEVKTVDARESAPESEEDPKEEQGEDETVQDHGDEDEPKLGKEEAGQGD